MIIYSSFDVTRTKKYHASVRINAGATDAITYNELELINYFTPSESNMHDHVTYYNGTGAKPQSRYRK